MPPDQSQAIGATVATFSIFIVVLALASIVFSVIIYWKIFSKAGYSGAMSLLMFVPIANLIAMCILAFGTWPIYEELNQLRQVPDGWHATTTTISTAPTRSTGSAISSVSQNAESPVPSISLAEKGRGAM